MAIELLSEIRMRFNSNFLCQLRIHAGILVETMPVGVKILGSVVALAHGESIKDFAEIWVENGKRSWHSNFGYGSVF